MFEERLDTLLQCVYVPNVWLYCGDFSNTESVQADIDKLAVDIGSCLHSAVNEVIRTRSYIERNMPGWNTYVRERHDAARSAYLDWLAVGKPRSGYYFESMKRTRATFKLAVRYCKNNIEQIKADACAVSVLERDCRKFWNLIYRISKY